MDIYKEAIGTLLHGHQTVGTTRRQLVDGKYDILKGVLLRAPGSCDPTPNTAAVWVGGKSVTSDSGPTGGMPLTPGESMFLPVDDPTQIYLISTDDNQDIAWITV
jgi:hypothetical protein